MGYRKLLLAASAAMVVAPFLPSANATPVNLDQIVYVPVHVGLTTTVNCSNNPGPTITITGTIVVGSVTTAVWFQNNVKGTHTTSPTVTTGSFGVVPATQDGSGVLSINKQPVPLTGGGWLDGSVGAGGNPWISIDVVDANGNSEIGGPQLIGKCVQLGKGITVPTSRDFTIPVHVSVLAQSIACDKSQSNVNLSSTDDFSQIDGRVLFDNNKNWTVHQAADAGTAGFHLVDAYHTTKGWGVGGAGGNPLTYLQFKGASDPAATDTGSTDAGGNEIWDISGWTTYSPVLLGRCNTLG